MIAPVVFTFPAKFRPYVASALESAVDRIRKDLVTDQVPEFMVDHKATGELAVVVHVGPFEHFQELP
jgi:hypothetical protein